MAELKPTDFVHVTVSASIRKREFADIRLAYCKQPDSAADPDAWSNCEKFEPGRKS